MRRPDLYSHDLLALGAHAGIGADLRALGQGGGRLRAAWNVARLWTVAMRYDPDAFSRRQIADMLDAVDISGLLQWLLR